MKYYVIINKRLKYIKVYSILKKIGQQNNFLTDLFIKIFAMKKQKKK